MKIHTILGTLFAAALFAVPACPAGAGPLTATSNTLPPTYVH